jgi:hypothetical protein
MRPKARKYVAVRNPRFPGDSANSDTSASEISALMER